MSTKWWTVGRLLPLRPTTPATSPATSVAGFDDFDDGELGPLQGADVYDDPGDEAWARFDGPDAWLEPRRSNRHSSGASVDPRLMRLGAVAAATVVLVPVMMAMADGGSGDELRSEDVPATVAASIAPPAAVTATPNTGVLITAGATAPATVAASDEPPAAAASSGAAEAEAEDEPECAGTYTVVAGDYWLRFVDSSGASLDEWLASNGADAETQMYEGDELCIPPGAVAPEPIPVQTAAPETTIPPTSAAAPTTPAPTPAPPPPPPPPAPVAAPAPPPAPVAAPARVASTDEVQALIREIWPDDIEERALQIAYNEARWRPDLNNWCCYGVFAIHFESGSKHGFLQRFGVTRAEQLFDARLNITIAYEMYKLSGWSPWSQTDPGA